MSTVQEIKSAIEQLSSFAKASEDRPLEERAALIAELARTSRR